MWPFSTINKLGAALQARQTEIERLERRVDWYAAEARAAQNRTDKGEGQRTSEVETAAVEIRRLATENFELRRRIDILDKKVPAHGKGGRFVKKGVR